MSRGLLCTSIALLLAAVSFGIMIARTRILGDEVKLPGGPGTWKITMVLHGRTTQGAQVGIATPLDVPHQQILREQARSDEMLQKPSEHRSDRRIWRWTPAPGSRPGPFRIRYECFCTVHPENRSRKDRAHNLYAAPNAGDDVSGEDGVEWNHADIAALARRLAEGRQRVSDQIDALFRHVDQNIAGEPSVPGDSASALECMRREGGDSVAKSRLLVALCRSQGIPARLVTGLTLTRDDEQPVHTWVEAWTGERWLPMCPFHHHFGKVPKTYLVFAYGDPKLVHGRGVRGLDYAFLVERVWSANEDVMPPGWSKRLFRAISLHALPLAEQTLVEFLLLLPIAALMICVFRNVIGLTSFGTFAPALVGLAFRDLRSWPGIFVFVGIMLVGWLMRRALNRFHLLQVPRTALMLTLVVSTITIFVVVANRQHVPTTRYISLFPLVILTGMIERFWTLEEEDSMWSSFRTLLSTLFIAACISLVISRQTLMQHMLRYPETVGLVVAALLVLGRYTGYRLSELRRFRDFIREPIPEPVRVASERRSLGPRRF
jgi:hypothetical protein